MDESWKVSHTETLKRGRRIVVNWLTLSLMTFCPLTRRIALAIHNRKQTPSTKEMFQAMVNKEEKAIILDQPHQIRFAQLCARKLALGLELRGMRRSRGQSMYAICKQAYGFRGSKQRVYEQMCDLMEQVKNGDVTLTDSPPG
jgi:hypothetical protein